MLVYSDEQYLVLIPNTMVLEKDGCYFYVAKSLYDNCTILKHRYELDRIGELIGGENNLEVIDWLTEQLPDPIDALAPFLRLVRTELPEDLELCVGSLHELFCTGMNPYAFVKMPYELRSGIDYGRTGNVYKEMWEGIMTQYVSYSKIEEMLENINQFNNIQFPVLLQPSVAGAYPMQGYVPQPVAQQEPEVDMEYQDAGDGNFYFDDDEDDDIDFSLGDFLGNSSEESNIEAPIIAEEEDTNNVNQEEVIDEKEALKRALLGGV